MARLFLDSLTVTELRGAQYERIIKNRTATQMA